MRARRGPAPAIAIGALATMTIAALTAARPTRYAESCIEAVQDPGRAGTVRVYNRWRTFTTRDGLPSDKINAVRVDGERVWAGTDQGLAVYEGGRWRTYTVADGLAHHVVLAIDVNRETGDVWVGTLGGLNRLSAGRWETFNQFNSGLANDVVYGISTQGDQLWVATAAGASRLDTRTGQWEIFTADNAPMHEPWTYGVHVNDGKAYIAAWGGGVLEYDLETHRWRDYRDPDGEMEIDLFPDDGLVHDITASVSYEDGILWVATYFGLSRYDGERWRGYFDDDSGLASLFINFVRARGPVAWICTDNGLNTFDGATWVTYQVDSIAGGGLAVVSDSARELERRHTATAIAHNYVLGVDFQGDTVWVATAKGLSQGVAFWELAASAKPGS